MVKVLLVDDHQMFAESVARMLDREPDLEVVGVAATAAEARLLAQHLHPDVAVVDYHLPDTNGAVLAAELRAADGGPEVVVLTGSGNDRALVDALEAGCAGFVLKTQAFDELVEAVRRVHSGESFIAHEMLAALLPRLRDRQVERTGPELTTREREVLELVAGGMGNAAIADQLFLSVNTVRNHVQSLLAKLGAHSKLEAVAVARRQGLLDASTAALPPSGD